MADDGSYAEPHPGDLTHYNQDVINGIVSRYLHPAFHCSVYFVISPTNKARYPIVRVPSHGAQPVCAKSDGPLINKHRVGVTQGVHYIRASGPRSVPIDTPDLWRDLLHRCVLAERDKLLSSIGRLFERPTVVADAPLLDELVDDAKARWSKLQASGWPVDPVENKSTVSFQFLQDDRNPVQAIALKQLLDRIREASNKAEAERQYTSPPFDMTYSGMSSPSVFLFGEAEGYESDSIKKDGAYLFSPSLSRVLTTGVGVEVRLYHEDTTWIKEVVEGRSSRKWAAGENLSPSFQASRMHAFVLFVRHFSQSFSDAARCIFLVDFEGLDGRRIADSRGGNFRSEKNRPHRNVKSDSNSIWNNWREMAHLKSLHHLSIRLSGYLEGRKSMRTLLSAMFWINSFAHRRLHKLTPSRQRVGWNSAAYSAGDKPDGAIRSALLRLIPNL